MRTQLPFILFLTVFLTLYGLLHLYLYKKLIRAFTLMPPYNVLILALFLLMLLAPILVNVLAKYENHLPATYLAYIGYIWMGGLFLFFCIHFLIDIYDGTVYLLSKFSLPVFARLHMGNKASLLMALLLSMVIMIYGRYEAENIQVETHVLKTEKLPPEANSLRIVQISDIHFSTINKAKLAQKIVEKIEGLAPDILVSTGDLTDRGMKEKEKVAELFRGLRVPYGKYAVTGNHEFYTGIQEAVEFTEKAGFRMLRNEGIAVAGIVNIAGVDDPTARRFGMDASMSEDEIIRHLPNKHLTILLKHRPMLNEKSPEMFDLQLSGHLHKGQIFPFSLLTSLLFPYHAGLFQLEGGSYFHVSRGTGTWGPPVRFLSPPEITVIEFRGKE